MLGQAVWTDVLTIWWFGPLLVVILVTMGWKKLLRLAGRVFGDYLSSHH